MNRYEVGYIDYKNDGECIGIYYASNENEAIMEAKIDCRNAGIVIPIQVNWIAHKI